MIFYRLEPQTTQLKQTHEKSDGPTIDYSRLTDSEVEGLESLLERATGAIAKLEDGEGAPTAAMSSSARRGPFWSPRRRSSQASTWTPSVSTSRR